MQSGLFDHQNYAEKTKQKHSGYFEEKNYIEKGTWKQRGFFDHRNNVKKTNKRGNDVNFSISKITSKKHVEMTQRFVEIWSSTYRRTIHFESTSIRPGAPIGSHIVGRTKCSKFLSLLNTAVINTIFNFLFIFYQNFLFTLRLRFPS